MNITKTAKRIIREPIWFYKATKQGLKNPKILFQPYYKLKRRKIIYGNSKAIKNFFFIQIGAHDGVSRDPIRKYILKFNWSGILVEPQKDVYEILKSNYKNHINLRFENSAISDRMGIIDFYQSPNSKLSSLHPDEWFKNRRDNIPYINRKTVGGAKKCQVNSITFSDLLDKYSINKIDLLQIDTEGYDFEIIKQIDFSRIKPLMINYEDHHFDKNMKKECADYVEKQGYRTFKVGFDRFAYIEKQSRV